MIGERLFLLRQMYGISQEGLARCVGVSQSQVCRIEQGERYPSLRFVLRFCRALRVPPNEVLFDELCLVDLPGEAPPRTREIFRAAKKLQRTANAEEGHLLTERGDKCHAFEDGESFAERKECSRRGL